MDHAVETLSADFDGEPFNIGFNVQYLIDAISQIDCERVVFNVADSGKAAKAVKPRADDAVSIDKQAIQQSTAQSAAVKSVDQIVITPNLGDIVNKLNSLNIVAKQGTKLGNYLVEVDSKISGALQIFNKCSS